MSPGVYKGLFVFKGRQNHSTDDQSPQLLATNPCPFFPMQAQN